MKNTTHNLPYPEPVDPVAEGAAAIKALAEQIDALVLNWRIQWGAPGVAGAPVDVDIYREAPNVLGTTWAMNVAGKSVIRNRSTTVPAYPRLEAGYASTPADAGGGVSGHVNFLETFEDGAPLVFLTGYAGPGQLWITSSTPAGFDYAGTVPGGAALIFNWIAFS